MKINDSVQVTTIIHVEPQVAFEIFTEETDLWWGKGPRFRPLSHPQGHMIFEGKVGGRLLEVVEDDVEPPFVLGRVEVWDPPSRLVFSMGVLGITIVVVQGLLILIVIPKLGAA
jgi:uncharacterized protein YndB with AHSA1/START domain